MLNIQGWYQEISNSVSPPSNICLRPLIHTLEHFRTRWRIRRDFGFEIAEDTAELCLRDVVDAAMSIDGKALYGVKRWHRGRRLMKETSGENLVRLPL